MKFRSFAWSTGAAVLALVLLVGCPVDPPASLFTVSGSIERPEGTGKTAYIKLVIQGADYTAPAQFSTSVLIVTDTANYSIPDVEAGTYTVYAFVDMDGSAAGDPDPLPDAGDWVYGAPAVTVTVNGDLTYQITADHASWATIVTYAVSGTISNSDVADGAFAYVKLVADGAGAEADALYLDQSDAFLGGAAWYTVTGVAPGTYGFYVFIDADGDAGVPIPTTMPEPGEWSYGGTVTVGGETTQDVGLTADWRRYAMFKVYGSFQTTHSTPGALAYVKLVPSMGEITAEAVAFTLSAAFSSGYAPYSLWVAEGSYTLYAFIDGDGDLAEASATTMPETGEWTVGDSGSTTFLVQDDTIKDLQDSLAWTEYRLGRVYGTFQENTAATGTSAYVMLVAPGEGPTAPPLYATSCVFNDSYLAAFSIEGVEYGEYDLYAFIDMNGNAATMAELPDNGDLMPAAYVYPTVLATKDHRQDCTEWTAVYNMSGMLFKTGLAEDEIAYVKIVESGVTYQATALYSTSTTVAVAGSGNYTFALLPAGAYSVHFFIDTNGNAAATDYLPDSSDYWASKDFTLGVDSTTLDVLDGEWGVF